MSEAAKLSRCEIKYDNNRWGCLVCYSIRWSYLKKPDPWSLVIWWYFPISVCPTPLCRCQTGSLWCGPWRVTTATVWWCGVRTTATPVISARPSVWPLHPSNTPDTVILNRSLSSLGIFWMTFKFRVSWLQDPLSVTGLFQDKTNIGVLTPRRNDPVSPHTLMGRKRRRRRRMTGANMLSAINITNFDPTMKLDSVQLSGQH